MSFRLWIHQNELKENFSFWLKCSLKEHLWVWPQLWASSRPDVTPAPGAGHCRAHLNHPCLNSMESEKHFLRDTKNLPRASVFTGRLSVLENWYWSPKPPEHNGEGGQTLECFSSLPMAQSEGGTKCHESVWWCVTSDLKLPKWNNCNHWHQHRLWSLLLIQPHYLVLKEK